MSVAELEKLRLKLDADGDGTVDNTYDLYPLQGVDVTTSKDAFSISPPGLSARENILLGISGMQADITITAYAWADGADRANGTAASTIQTLEEQLAYLEDTMHDPSFSASWQLDHLTGGAFNDDEVFLESVDKQVIAQDSPKWKEISLRLRRGQSIG